jgi:transcriptional regulator with XRE-family HTH domain
MEDETGNPRTYLREWRQFRQLTQAQLGEKAGTTGPMINHLENGARSLSHKWLMKLAPALGTTPGFILDHNPFDLPRDLFEIWNRGDAEEQQTLVRVADTLIPYRAEGA